MGHARLPLIAEDAKPRSAVPARGGRKMTTIVYRSACPTRVKQPAWISLGFPVSVVLFLSLSFLLYVEELSSQSVAGRDGATARACSLACRMTTVRDRLSRHRELLGSSKVVSYLSVEWLVRVTSAVVLPLVDSARVTLSASLSVRRASYARARIKCMEHARMLQSMHPRVD